MPTKKRKKKRKEKSNYLDSRDLDQVIGAGTFDGIGRFSEQRLPSPEENLDANNKEFQEIEMVDTYKESPKSKSEQAKFMMNKLSALEELVNKGKNPGFTFSIKNYFENNFSDISQIDPDFIYSAFKKLTIGIANVELDATKTSILTGYTNTSKKTIKRLINKYAEINPSPEDLTWILENAPKLNDTTYKNFKDELERKILEKKGWGVDI